MHDQGTADGAACSVSGLGVCDVWRLELTRDQWPWLADELDEMRGPLEEELAVVKSQHAEDPSQSTAERIGAIKYELRIVAMMRARLLASIGDEPVIFAGPAELVRELVIGALREVVSAFGDIVTAGPLGDRDAWSRVTTTADAARAWARTVAACRELETFRFDPTADPVLLR
jgi:hypothetical protein